MFIDSFIFRNTVIALSIVYITVIVYYLPMHVFAVLIQSQYLFGIGTVILLTAFRIPETALFLGMAYLVTIQVYRNRLEIITGISRREQRHEARELKHEAKKEIRHAIHDIRKADNILYKH